jgi:hypothetical protein
MRAGLLSPNCPSPTASSSFLRLHYGPISLRHLLEKTHATIGLPADGGGVCGVLFGFRRGSSAGLLRVVAFFLRIPRTDLGCRALQVRETPAIGAGNVRAVAILLRIPWRAF